MPSMKAYYFVFFPAHLFIYPAFIYFLIFPFYLATILPEVFHKRSINNLKPQTPDKFLQFNRS